MLLRYYLGIVEVESVIVVEVGFDAVEVEQNVVELFQQEEARRHTLPSWWKTFYFLFLLLTDLTFQAII